MKRRCSVLSMDSKSFLTLQQLTNLPRATSHLLLHLSYLFLPVSKHPLRVLCTELSEKWNLWLFEYHPLFLHKPIQQSLTVSQRSLTTEVDILQYRLDEFSKLYLRWSIIAYPWESGIQIPHFCKMCSARFIKKCLGLRNGMGKEGTWVVEKYFWWGELK